MNEPNEEQIDQAFSCETKYAAYRLGWADAMASLIESPATERVELPAKIAGYSRAQLSSEGWVSGSQLVTFSGRSFMLIKAAQNYGYFWCSPPCDVLTIKGEICYFMESETNEWCFSTREAAEAFAREHVDK